MKRFQTSSSLNLHHRNKENLSDDIRAGLAFNKKMGFDGANLDLEMPIFDADGWQPYMEQALRDSEEIGLPIRIAHLPFVSGNLQKDWAFFEKFNEKIIRAMDGAKLLGVEYAVLHPVTMALPGTQYNRKEQHELVIRNLTPVMEHAAKIGLAAVVENMRVTPHFYESHRYCQSPDELCDVADTFGVGVCWDFGHANISGIRQSEGLAYVGNRLKVLHINDNKAFEDDHLLPFMGNIDWKDAMHGLALAGFEGMMNFEISTGRLPGAVREDFARYILHAADQLMAYVE